MSNGDGQASTLESKLYALRCAYMASLPEEFAQLSAIAKDFGPHRIDELFNRLHRLAGTAGSLGQWEISAHARPLVEQVRHWKEDPGGILEDQVVAQLVRDVEALSRLVVEIKNPAESSNS